MIRVTLLMLSRLLLATSLLCPSLLPAQTVGEMVDRATAAYARMSTFRAEFEQVLNNPLTGSRITARGEVLRKAPNLLSITFRDPAGDRIVADGKAVWVYLPSTTPGQVVKLQANDANATRLDPASQFLRAPKARFNMSDGGSATIRGRRTRLVLLAPKGSETFTRAKVWIDERDGVIRQFEVTEPSGLVRLITVTNLSPNVAIRSSVFSYTPPRGVRIIDQARLGASR